MDFEFDEKIEKDIQKSLKATLRLFRQQQSSHEAPRKEPPSYDEFTLVLEDLMRQNKEANLKKLRTPSLRELFERAWDQNLRSYTTQKLLKDSYEALTRRYKRSPRTAPNQPQ